MLRNREGDQAEDADRRIAHHDAGHADHDVADDVEEVEHGLAAVAEARKREAEDHRKEDDLQHAALRKGFHRVDRDDVEQRVDEIGRSHRLHLEAFSRKIEADARLNEVGEDKADRHSNGGRNGVDEQHLHSDAAKLGRVGNAGGARNNRGKNQRNHNHSDQSNEQRAERLQVSLRKR